MTTHYFVQKNNTPFKHISCALVIHLYIMFFACLENYTSRSFVYQTRVYDTPFLKDIGNKKNSLSYMKELLKLYNNFFYSFFISLFVFEIFRFKVC